MILNTVIVEDEPLSRMFLDNLLKEFCEEIKVTGKATAEDEAVALINDLKPDLIFLDIELQQGSGFGVLQKINNTNAHVVFTTAFDHQSIQAIRFSGADFIAKPIDIETLKATIKNITTEPAIGREEKAIHHLLETLQHNNVPQSLAVPVEGGLEYVTIKDISRIKCAPEGCFFFIKSGKTIACTSEIKQYELLLKDLFFIRTHLQHIVNLFEIKKVQIENVIMKDETIIPLSAKKVEELNNRLSAIH